MKKYLNDPLMTTALSALVIGIIAGISMFYSNQAMRMGPVLALVVIMLSLLVGVAHRKFKDKKESKI